MKKIIRRLINPRGFIIFVIVTTILFLATNQEVWAKEQPKSPYLIKVNRVHNTITVYEKDEEGKFKIPIKAMICSVGKKGSQTIQGTFQTKAKYRWKELMGNVWGQYATRIVGGILFHSVYYYENGNPATLATKEYNKLGVAASHGCIRLTVVDAKWIYDNCAVGTTVVIYDDKKNPGPLGKPDTIIIPTSVRWDPTDPNIENPYNEKAPTITGVKDLIVAWGDEINLLRGVKAKSGVGTDITSELSTRGEVDFYNAGEYEITYSVTDSLGKIESKVITVTVEESTEVPEFYGISDKYVKEGTVINEEYALAGVTAFCANIKLDKKIIDVAIEMVNDEEYSITYSIQIGQTVVVTDSATVHVDKEAPVFAGINERIIEVGEVPDESFALSEVTVSDNYTDMANFVITVTIDENPEGSYLVTYEAVDEAGNTAKEQVVFHN